MYEEKSVLYDAMEKVLKGLELKIPDKFAYEDKYGKKRTNCRYLWWDKNVDIEPRVSLPKNIKVPNPFSKYLLIETQEHLKLISVFIAVCWGVIFNFGSYWLLRKRDLL